MTIEIERWEDVAQIPEITALLHAAYAQLAEMGFRYVATYQDDSTTRERLETGESFIAREAAVGGRIVGTVSLRPPGLSKDALWFRQAGVAVFGQFGVLPDCSAAGSDRDC